MVAQNTPQKLAEVSLIRPILTIALVFYHAFLIYNGGWTKPTGFEPNLLYAWFAKFAIAFLMEMFVFISGYVYCYQKEVLGKNTNIKGLIKKKFDRLYVPALAFSALFYFFFFNGKTLKNGIIEIGGGTGHLWFLVMLFLVFILFELLQKHVKLNEKFKISFLIVISIFSFLASPLQFQISSAFYYLLFFYLGYIFYKTKDKYSQLIKKKNAIFIWLLFVVCFVAARFFIDKCLSLDTFHGSFYMSFIRLALMNSCKIVFSVFGVFALMISGLLMSKTYTIGGFLIFVDAFSMGIYVFQEFFLRAIYYYTSIPSIVGPQLLPWVGFFIAFTFSSLLSYAVKKI